MKGKNLRYNIESYECMNISFSQIGEDIIIQKLIEEQELKPQDGVYIDAGAYDPISLSNTYALFLKGWTGINIDPNPNCIERYNKIRKNDKNIQAILSNEIKDVYYNYYDNAPTNKISNSPNELNVFGSKPIKSETLKTNTIDNILQTINLKTNIHFLNIDCEGEDLNVLKGINLEVYKPRIICIEAHNDELASEITSYLKVYNYFLYSRNSVSLIFSL